MVCVKHKLKVKDNKLRRLNEPLLFLEVWLWKQLLIDLRLIQIEGWS